ncbi:MAG: UPF0175 family protein [Rhodothermales bacterium]
MVAITDDILRAARVSEQEFRQEAAVLLFKKGLPLMKAAELAEMDRFAFQHLLAGRQIPVHYDADDFDQDVRALQSL